MFTLAGYLCGLLERVGSTGEHGLDGAAVRQAASGRTGDQPAANWVDNRARQRLRNGVAERVSTACVDLYPWVPEERYEVIVASLSQAPGDPFAPVVSHRPRDFWGRNLIDHLIGPLPQALADDGVAYIMELSIIGQRRTIELLERAGYVSRVVDYALVGVDEDGEQELDQITRVEEGSDAYHLKLGERGTMVAYLLEVTRSRQPLG